MKNITLSMPDDLLRKSREYAEQHGKSLNKFIREILSKYIQNQQKTAIENLLRMSNQVSIKTKSVKWSRDEIYDRKIFS